MYATLPHMPLIDHAPKSESEQKNTLATNGGGWRYVKTLHHESSFTK